MGLTHYGPTPLVVYRRFVAWKIDTAGRPIRQLLLHQDEPHDQHDTPDNLVLIPIPPNMTDPCWDREEDCWKEHSAESRLWRYARWAIVPLLFSLLFLAEAKAQGVGSGGVGSIPAGSASPLTTKGDVYGYSTTDARIPVGTNDDCFIADSTAGLGVKWDTCPGAGGGDSVTVNGSATTDVDLDDADPAAPSNGINVKWQLNTATAPDSVSAHLLFTDFATLTKGSGSAITVTWNVGATDPVVAYTSGQIAWSGATTYLFSVAPTFTGITLGSVLFAGTAGLTSQDNSNFFWNDTDNRLGIGTTTPSHDLSIVGHVSLDHISSEAGDHALEVVVDAAGFGDVKGVDIFYDTGAVAAGSDEAIVFVSVDQSDATGGDVAGYSMLSTGGSATVYGLKVGAVVNPVIQLSGTFGNMDSALNKAVNALTAFTTSDPAGANNVDIFVADNDTITIGDAAKFQELEFILEVVASGAGIAPTFEFSTGVGTWTAFFPTDGTSGMVNTGVVQWENADIPTWAVGTGSEFLVRITRTRNSLTTVPTEDTVQITAVIEYEWDASGDVRISTLSLGAAGVKLSADGDGAITFLGLGNGFDEDLTFNLDDTSNEVVVSSSTGVASFNLSGMTLPGADVAAASVTATQLAANQNISTIGITIDGGGSAITTGQKGYIEVPFACTISRATTLADQSGSIVIDVWKDTYANYPPVDADSITASAPPTISTAVKAQDATLTGWTTSVAAGDILGFNVDSITTVQRAHLTLKCDRT